MWVKITQKYKGEQMKNISENSLNGTQKQPSTKVHNTVTALTKNIAVDAAWISQLDGAKIHRKLGMKD